jgi:hypothetical protein
MKGLILIYVNFHPDLQQTPEGMLDLVRKTNSDLIRKLQDDAHYGCVLIPTTKESCRVEKIDFDKPFPYYRNCGIGMMPVDPDCEEDDED